MPPAGAPVTATDTTDSPVVAGPSITLDKAAGAPSGNMAGSTIAYTFVVTNTGNVCFKGGTITHNVGNCGWWGWQGNVCNYTSTCPPLSPGQGCVVTQKCNVGWYSAGTFGCQTTVKCAQPPGYSASGQASCYTQVW